MAEYIEREALLEDIDEAVKHRGMGEIIGQTLRRYILRQPAADVAPVVHGRWIPQSNNAGGEYTICSACRCNLQVAADGEIGLMDMRGASYCPNCGAKMDGGDDDAAD